MSKFFSSSLHPVISGYKSGVMRGNTHKKSWSATKIGQFGNSWLQKFMQLAISMDCIENTASYCRLSLQMCMWGETWPLPCGYLNLGSTAEVQKSDSNSVPGGEAQLYCHQPPFHSQADWTPLRISKDCPSLPLVANPWNIKSLSQYFSDFFVFYLILKPVGSEKGKVKPIQEGLIELSEVRRCWNLNCIEFGADVQNNFHFI